MSTLVRVLLFVVGGLLLLVLAYIPYVIFIGNPRIVQELIDDPDGPRAAKVMLLTLPSGRAVPVNYLHEPPYVYAGADGRWWKELTGAPEQRFPVRVLVRGKTYSGMARAVLDEPDYTQDIFSRLRPNALPGFGTLVEIHVDEETETEPTPGG